MLSKEEMLSTGTVKIAEIPDCDEWGVIKVRQFSWDEFIAFDEMPWPFKTEAIAELMIRCIVNEDGSPRFTDADKPALLNLRAGVYLMFMRGLRKVNAPTKQRVEETEKNLQSSPGDSTSIN